VGLTQSRNATKRLQPGQGMLVYIIRFIENICAKLITKIEHNGEI
jgi:hypothetical protein